MITYLISVYICVAKLIKLIPSRISLFPCVAVALSSCVTFFDCIRINKRICLSILSRRFCIFVSKSPLVGNNLSASALRYRASANNSLNPLRLVAICSSDLKIAICFAVNFSTSTAQWIISCIPLSFFSSWRILYSCLLERQANVTATPATKNEAITPKIVHMLGNTFTSNTTPILYHKRYALNIDGND